MDHIIPESCFNRFEPDRRLEYRDDWNTQPMHEKCNGQRFGQISGLPDFKCSCHYFSIDRKGNLHIREITQGFERAHLFFEEFATDFPLKDLFVFSQFDMDRRGFAKGMGGHHLACISRNLVGVFNWFELARCWEGDRAVASET